MIVVRHGHAQIFLDVVKLSVHALDLGPDVAGIKIAVLKLVVYVLCLPEHARILSPNVAIGAVNAEVVPDMSQHPIQMPNFPRECPVIAVVLAVVFVMARGVVLISSASMVVIFRTSGERDSEDADQECNCD